MEGTIIPQRDFFLKDGIKEICISNAELKAKDQYKQSVQVYLSGITSRITSAGWAKGKK
jgi:hypothetical protein